MPSRRELANAIRALAMDAVEAAKSGHPGAPMGMADIAEVLWNGLLKHHPGNPGFVDRDRFVLSNGHASMLLYALLHLSGYALPIEQLKQFRKLHSKTPGHPEAFETPGVETTTGPLGQGIANAVGMALAEQLLARRFNRPGHTIVDHRTWCFVGDGCLMEGISHEVCSLAGTLALDKLIAIYDSNGISIDGKIGGWFTDDTAKRFEAYGWRVIDGVDGHDAFAVETALKRAMVDEGRPTLVICRTTIGFGAPHKAGSESSHGAPLGKDEVAATRQALGWKPGAFEVPAEIYAAFDGRARGAAIEAQWNARFAAYAQAYPDLAAEFQRRQRGELPDQFAAEIQEWVAATDRSAATIASRKASQNALAWMVERLPELVGGSADLAHSNLTLVKGSKDVRGDDSGNGNYVYYGVREFGMTAIANGLALHGGFKTFTATFLVFSDYARNAVRMSALIPTPVIQIYTHDSIGLGEDGPTHQPIEHLASLRLIPNNHVWRPADAVETAVAWAAAIQRNDGPSCLALSRQNLPHQFRTPAQLGQIARGGYVLLDGSTPPQLILLATGSEVDLAMQAARQLNQEGASVRVVSLPCTNVFDAQPLEYRESVLPGWCRKRLAVEAASSDFWAKYVGLDGEVIGMRRFGASAPIEQVYPYFGFTVDKVLERARALLAR